VRVVGAQDLEELLVARGADVRGDDPVHGVVLLSPALQSQPDRARGGHGQRRELRGVADRARGAKDGTQSL